MEYLQPLAFGLVSLMALQMNDPKGAWSPGALEPLDSRVLVRRLHVSFPARSTVYRDSYDDTTRRAGIRAVRLMEVPLWSRLDCPMTNISPIRRHG